MKISMLFAMMSVYAWLATINMGAPPKVDSDMERHPVRIACIGDSITQGAGVENPKENAYPVQLAKALEENYHVRNFGVSGTTLMKRGDFPYWKTAAFRKALNFQPKIVIIMLGTNDTKLQNWKYKEDFVKDYRELAKQFSNLSTKPHIYFCHPCFVVREGAFGIVESGVLEQIPLIDDLAKELDCITINIHSVFKLKPELIPDNVHPNAEGAKLMMETILEALRKNDVR